MQKKYQLDATKKCVLYKTAWENSLPVSYSKRKRLTTVNQTDSADMSEWLPTPAHPHWLETRYKMRKLNGSVKEPNMFHNYETEKIMRKASDMAENLQLY